MITDPTPPEKASRENHAVDPSLPALFGGPPIRPEGPPDWPPADPEILNLLEQACRDGSWGKYHARWCEQLEQRLAEYHKRHFATLCCSGTFAVELALRSLGIKAGDEVILAGYDFSGNFQSILAIGARPVLIDVHPENGNLDPARIEEALSERTRALVASHLHGGVAPLREVRQHADRHGLKIVEDAAQMPGAVIQGRKAGTWGDVGVLSFGGSKLLTAGRGGAMLTRDPEAHQRAKLHCNRGNQAFPLSQLQAAVLLPQLEKLDPRNARRAQNVRDLLEILRDQPGLKPLVNHTDDTQPGYYKLGFLYDPAAFGGIARETWVGAMRAEGIAFDAGFRALAGRSSSRCRKVGDLREAQRAGDQMVVLHHPILLGSRRDMDEIGWAVRKLADYWREGR